MRTTHAFAVDSPLQDIGSGNCHVHNTLLLDDLQKSVLYAPWHFHPTPFWCAICDHCNQVVATYSLPFVVVSQ